jgi:prepilin-type N-terminal cleavage/methylation domain-containing protein
VKRAAGRSPARERARCRAFGRGRTTRARAGFTILELMIAMAIATTLTLFGITAFKQWTEANTVEKAARVVAADVALTRQHAIQRRESVSLVADEANQAYEIRTSGGVVLLRRQFDAANELPLTLLDVQLPGDSVAFNSRGLVSNAGVARIDVGRLGRTQQVNFNALGRTRIQRQ